MPEAYTTRLAYMVAGAGAGIMEHVGMFPIDTIRVRGDGDDTIYY